MRWFHEPKSSRWDQPNLCVHLNHVATEILQSFKFSLEFSDFRISLETDSLAVFLEIPLKLEFPLWMNWNANVSNYKILFVVHSLHSRIQCNVLFCVCVCSFYVRFNAPQKKISPCYEISHGMCQMCMMFECYDIFINTKLTQNEYMRSVWMKMIKTMILFGHSWGANQIVVKLSQQMEECCRLNLLYLTKMESSLDSIFNDAIAFYRIWALWWFHVKVEVEREKKWPHFQIEIPRKYAISSHGFGRC